MAYFLLLDFIEKSQKDNFILRNKKYLVKHFIDEMLFTKQVQEEQNLNLNIQNVLELNGLLAKFDFTVNQVADYVTAFWQNLINEKESF